MSTGKHTYRSQIRKIIIVGSYPPPYGGQSVHVRELRSFLTTKGYDVNVLNIGSGRKIKSDEYISVTHGLDFISKIVLLSIKGYSFHHHANGHNNKSWALIFLNCLVALVLKREFILTLHSGMCPDYMRTRPKPVKALIKFHLNLARCVIAVNKDIYRALIELGVAANKIRIIEAFSLNDSFKRVIISTDLDRYIRTHEPLIACVGVPRPEYGLHLIISLVNELIAKYPRMGVVVIGAASPNERQSSPNNKAIKWLGPQDRLTSLYLIANSDLFVRPSFKDGDAVSVREAMALGVPVVASKVGHRPEGVMTFESGNAREFRLAVEKVLQSLRISKTPQDHKYDDNLQRIMNCYEKCGH